MIFAFFIYLFVRAVALLLLATAVTMFGLAWIGLKLIALLIGHFAGDHRSSDHEPSSQAAWSDRR